MVSPDAHLRVRSDVILTHTLASMTDKEEDDGKLKSVSEPPTFAAVECLLSWEALCKTVLRPRLEKVFPARLIKQQLNILDKVLHGSVMDSNRETFLEWFNCCIDTLETVVTDAWKLFPSSGQGGTFWPVTHQKRLIAIHSLPPRENMQPGDCFFLLPPDLGKSGWLCFKHLKEEGIPLSSLPFHQFDVNFFTSLSGVLGGNGLEEFNLLLMDEQGKVEGISVREFLSPHLEASRGQLLTTESSSSSQGSESYWQNQKFEARVDADYPSAADLLLSNDNSKFTRKVGEVLAADLLSSAQRCLERIQIGPSEQDQQLCDSGDSDSSRGATKRGEGRYESSRNEEMIRKAKKKLPERIKDLSPQLRDVLSAQFNTNGIRLLADTLGKSVGESNSVGRTEQLASQPSTLDDVLKQHRNVPCTQLVDAIVQENELMVLIEAIHNYYLKKNRLKLGVSEERPDEKGKFPLSRSISSPTDSETSASDDHRGRVRSWHGRKRPKAPVQISRESRHQDERKAHALKSELAEGNPRVSPKVKDLYDPHARDLWESIDSEDESAKPWTCFMTALTKQLVEIPKDKDGSFSAEKGLFTVLVPGGNFRFRRNADVLIKEENFSRLVKWFGPCTSDENGFVQKIFQLIRRSREGSSKHSWFAGNLTGEESQEILEEKDKGTFLVRFSESLADEGGFSLDVKTEEDVEKFSIEGVPERQVLLFKYGEFDKEEFSSLLELVRRIKIKGIRADSSFLTLKKSCPKLPFSRATTGYKSK